MHGFWQLRVGPAAVKGSRAVCSENVPRLPPVCESGSFLDRDVKPERLKLPDVATDSFLGVAPIEVVGPKLLVGHAGAHDVERNLEDLMPNGHDRLLVPRFRANRLY